ncbi:DNA polymerase II [Haloprofundus marisrubri]|uniref:DNA polymerase II small subunit n=1 Tax=Haloprofundus marisrubri TaxID=1514971 RepID=A0A0W1R427_9EURY|nr:DNA-directed DNA polymerase II small subunit [Haloprofundus marisrubri]KTG07975.1 DNA polymerase II [Haloprofundus marisrubri]
MPLETPSRIVKALASRGYNAEREAVTLLASAANPAEAMERALDAAPDHALRLTAEHVRAVLDGGANAADAPTKTNSEPVGSGDLSASDGTAVSDGSRASSSSSPSDESSRSSATPATSTRTSTDSENTTNAATDRSTPTNTADMPAENPSTDNPSVSTAHTDENSSTPSGSPVETEGSTTPSAGTATGTESESVDPRTVSSTDAASESSHVRDPAKRSLEITNDMTGASTGTGEYKQFVTTFRDRYDRLSKLLRGRVNHRPTKAIGDMVGGSEVDLIGLVNDVRSTASGHWLVELEDTTGTFPCLVMKDKGIADNVAELLMDECIAIQGTLSDDSGIVFVDTLHFPDVPRTFRPKTADRHVQAALISDVHVGSQEFMADAWHSFTDWLHTEEAEPVEYLLIAGDMVEGVGVYPNQDEELDTVDIYDQYEEFSEHLKEVPADTEIVMIPGNHDAVRLAEPQPGFDEELRDIMTAHDARITSNPSTVTIENVSVLMYHGVSLDEVIAELPSEKASYDEPHKAMYQLLKKRHVAPQYGGHMRLAPEERDYLVIDDVPEVFHTGHVHKLGWGKYHNVLAVNSGCWQEQTDFQKSVNINPDSGYAPILDLDTLDMTVRKFA